jgi:hypothetical protein
MLRKGMVTVIVAAVALGAGCATDPQRSSEFRALETQLTAAQSELADTQTAAQAAADTSRSELEALQDETARLESELADAAASRQTAGARYARLADLVETQVAFSMWVAPEDIEDIQNLGVDTSPADRIIEERQWGTTWEQFALSGGGFAVNRLIARIDDQALETAWISFNNSPVGSDEEYAALSAFLLRLHELTIESLQDADPLLSPPQQDAT